MNKFRGEVAFPLAGEGAFIRFSWNDLVTLEREYGDAEYFGVIETKMALDSPSAIQFCLSVGLYQRGPDNLVIRLTPDYFGDLGWNIQDAAPLIIDAVSQAHSGKTYAEVRAEAEKQNLLSAVQEAKMAKALKEAVDNDEDPFTVLKGLNE
jgi:hypothetical protein